MLKSGIYKITNIRNGKVYIGQSNNLYTRKNKHFSDLKNNKHQNAHLQRAFNKYGIKAFRYEIICRCELSEIDELEKYYIMFTNSSDYNFGYNIERGGKKNKIISDETREKLSKSHLGYKPTEGALAKKSESMKRHWSNNELRRKEASERMRELRKHNKSNVFKPFLGKHLSEEHKQKISDAQANDLGPAIKAYQDGMKLRKCANEFHVDQDRLSHKLKELGIFYSAQDKLRDAVEMYKNGFCINYLKKHLHVSPSLLSKKLKELGIFRSNSMLKKGKPSWNTHDLTPAIEDYKNGMTLKDSARKNHVGSSRLSAELKHLNLLRR